MSCTEISTLVNYEPPPYATHCGEIYCTESLNNFVAQCTTCSKQFNLLSCSLFTKHIKECFQNIFDYNNTPQNTLTQDIINEEGTLKLEIVTRNDKPHVFDELLEDIEYMPDYLDEDNLPLKEVMERRKMEGIIAEYKKHPILWNPQMSRLSTESEKDKHYRQIMESINTKFKLNLTQDKLYQQIMTLRKEYKAALERNLNLEQALPDENIPKFNPKLWYFEQLSFIQGNNDDNNTGKRKRLWYFDDLSFIDAKTTEEDNSLIPTKADVDVSSESLENSTVEYKPYESLDTNPNTEDGESDFILALIEEYKKYPYLYDNKLYQTNCRLSRIEGLTNIQRSINKRFDTTYTNNEIRIKICRLRSTYKRILRAKEKFENFPENINKKYIPQWKYFDKLSFIGTKESDLYKSQKKTLQTKQFEMEMDKTKVEEEEVKYDEESRSEEDKEYTSNKLDIEVLKKVDPLEHDDDRKAIQNDHRESCEIDFKTELSTDRENLSVNDEEDDEEYQEEDDEINNPKCANKKRDFIIAIIEEYKKLPCLWSAKQATSDNYFRREAYDQIRKNINSKFNTDYSIKYITNEIWKLRTSYKRMLQRKQKNPTIETKLWFAKMLSFIEEKEQDQDGTNEAKNSLPESDESGEENTEEVLSKKHKILSEDIILKIIDLYKSEPILWDTNHLAYNLRIERKKTIEKLIQILANEHECYLSVKEFRYRISQLREAYFKDLRQEKSTKKSKHKSSQRPKQYFFEQMSFLEPFAQKFPVFKKNSNVDMEELNQDFTYLVENKQLMIEFIEVYKSHPCLWNSRHRDKDNQSAHSEAYEELKSTFSKYNINLTKEQIFEATRFLHISHAKQEKNNQKNPTSECWFYDYLNFLTKVPKTTKRHCSHCDQYFHTLVAYEKHVIEIVGDYPYKCSVCNAGFISRSKYSYHQYTHKEPLKCDQCDFQAYDKHNFTVHMHRHNRIHSFKCPECDKGFVTSTELMRHKRMHTGERPFVCDLCGKSLTSKTEFIRHTKRHNNQRDYKCELCEKAFYTSNRLREHMASHSTERRHVCDTCGAAFKRRNTLQQHKALHAEIKKHDCKICGKMFAQKAGLYSHMKSHGNGN